MRLNSEQLQSLINEVLNKIQLDLIRGNAQDDLESVLSKYGISQFIEEITPNCEFYRNNPRGAKILVLAVFLNKIDEWKMRAKKRFGIDPDKIDFVELKSNFNFERLRNSDVYSDIIVGPIPHKGVGIGDNSSFLAAVANHPEEYPKVHRMQDGNGNLVISQSAFERCLQNSNFVRECI